MRFVYFTAIIGAGIGGASTAFFLREHFGADAQISIFERSQVGGRLATVKMAGATYEVGGSVIHPANHLMKSLLQKMGISAIPILRVLFEPKPTKNFILNFKTSLTNFCLKGLQARAPEPSTGFSIISSKENIFQV